MPKQEALPLIATCNLYKNIFSDGYAGELLSNPRLLLRSMCLGAAGAISLRIALENPTPAGLIRATGLMTVTYIATSLIHKDDEGEDF